MFWCALCHMDKPLQSTKAMEAHRGYTAGSKPVGKKSCVRGPAGKRNTTIDEQTAEGYLFFTDPPQPSSSRAGSRAGRGSGPSSSRGGCGGGRGCGGQGGRGKKSAVSKAADKARLATLMAVRKEVEAAGGSWDPVRGCAVDSCRAVPDDVECMIAWASRRVRRLKLRERPQQRMRLSTLMPRRMHDWQAVGVGAGGWRAGCERRAQRAEQNLAKMW